MEAALLTSVWTDVDAIFSHKAADRTEQANPMEQAEAEATALQLCNIIFTDYNTPHPKKKSECGLVGHEQLQAEGLQGL